jgi:hypothetical protein
MQEQSAARVARVWKADAISVAGGLYQPVRRQLGIRAFGVNAYFASSAGDQLVEPHDETGSGSGGHAELYVVLAGRASFVVGGSEIDAPAGTLVYVPAVETRREARAVEDDTAAVVIGAPADRELPISPFEFWFTAEGPYNEGDYQRAIEIVSEGLTHWPDHPVSGLPEQGKSIPVKCMRSACASRSGFFLSLSDLATATSLCKVRTSTDRRLSS